jgi:ribulose-phosphate 3-epimerase
VKVAPSIIAADFSIFQQEIKKVEQAGADLLHLDVMDGVFVPNLTFGPMIVKAIDAITDLELDAHLMIVKPEKYIGQFLEAGTDWLSFHREATEHTDQCIKNIQDRGKYAGLAINPETSIAPIKKYLERVNYVLIMTVNPGFYGQKFMDQVLDKIELIRKFIDQHNYDCLIEVDGGVNSKTAGLVKQAGADVIVAGAGIFKQSDYSIAIKDLRCSKV